jgi:hypothetical protein
MSTKLRARIFSGVGLAAGRYWYYEIRDTAMPSGWQVQSFGVRDTWVEALDAALAALS